MKIIAPAIAVAVLALSTPAAAQEKKDRRVRIGLGGQFKPAYPGARDSDFRPLFDFDLAKGVEEFRIETPDDRFGIRLISAGRFTAGPAAAYQGSRKDRDVGAAVGKVDATIEVGGYADYLVNDSLRVRAELVKGVTGHEGITGQVGIDHFWRDGDKYAVTLGPRLLFSDDRFQRAYFGVSPAAAARTGLPVYTPGGGIHAVALASGVQTQFGPRWGLFGYARGERLVGDAAKSPIVRTYGRRNQLAAGIGVSYAFTVRR
ncbi:outer membrane protein [Sphingomonas kaistensis]|uniref:Outer membrane protein n=1 Tax=Sphingomonas kaistensis TaxID=298708 RepID=A0A7X6BFZ3_9SPHN|nr:MipA/OmpV family protein [Sphingomonas kaistensis]NJC04925.1 outer membrane protein [Sphingomonas kaistensis]